MKYTAFVFDFDFTLADASPAIITCANNALRTLGFPEREPDAIRRTIGMTLANSFASLSGSSDITLAEQYRELFRIKADEIMTAGTELFPDTAQALRLLKHNGKKTAIVTSKNHYRIDEALAKFGITDLVDIIIGFEDVTVHKPDPEGILKVIASFEAAKSEILYIGDSVIDQTAASNAGVDFAAVTTGTTTDFTGLPCITVEKNLTGILRFTGII